MGAYYLHIRRGPRRHLRTDRGTIESATMKTYVAIFVAFGALVSTGKAENKPVSCLDEIEGCGIFIDDLSLDFWCLCLSSLSPSLAFDYDLYCLIEPELDCCPCDEISLLSGNGNKTSCVDERDLRLLKRLIDKARKLGQRAAKRCPDGINEDCAGRLMSRIEGLNCAIISTTNLIEMGCS